MWDVRHLSRPLRRFRASGADFTCTVWHPDNPEVFATGSSDGSLVFWATTWEDPQLVVPPPVEPGMLTGIPQNVPMYAMAWHPQGHILATGVVGAP